MSKRSAMEAALGASPPKRLHLETFADLDFDDREDDYTSAQTPSSVADADSPVTAATTPRAKFPSDFKTLVCTWPGCPKTFNRPARLRDHLNSHTNSRPFKCTYEGCDKDYIEDKHLKQHVKAVHTLERKHVCQREGCGKSFTTGTRLKRHQAVHEGADRFRCEDCGQSFRKKDTLNRHVRKDHLGKPEHQCSAPGCREEFDTKGALNRHRERVHGEMKFWCDECGLKTLDDGTQQRIGFTTETLLQAHLKHEHQNCMFCEFKSAAQWEMERHVEMYHSGKSVADRKTEACPYDGCLKKFTKKSNLNAHIRTAHEGFRFVCGDVELAVDGWSNDQGCGCKLSTKARLEDHVRFVHLGQERPKLSTAEPSQAADLIDDISGVTNQAKQSIPCPQCAEVFIRYADMHAHVAVEHDATEAPAEFLSHDQSIPELPVFGDDDEGASAWPDDMPQEEIFAARMDYGPPRDEWLEDEANILLLARDMPELDMNIDPSLGAM